MGDKEMNDENKIEKMLEKIMSDITILKSAIDELRYPHDENEYMPEPAEVILESDTPPIPVPPQFAESRIKKFGTKEVLWFMEDNMQEGDTFSIDGVTYHDGQEITLPVTLNNDQGRTIKSSLEGIVRYVVRSNGVQDMYIIERPNVLYGKATIHAGGGMME